jgi:hypothetical protein
MRCFLKTTALTRAVAMAVALSVAGMALPTAVQAGHGTWGSGKPHYQKHFVHKPHIVRKDRRRDSLAAGVFGFVAGAAIASALSQPRYHAVPHHYAYVGPAPWTPDWYAYCASKYRSFNPNTGLYLAYTGVWRFCQ